MWPRTEGVTQQRVGEGFHFNAGHSSRLTPLPSPPSTPPRKSSLHHLLFPRLPSNVTGFWNEEITDDDDDDFSFVLAQQVLPAMSADEEIAASGTHGKRRRRSGLLSCFRASLVSDTTEAKASESLGVPGKRPRWWEFREKKKTVPVNVVGDATPTRGKGAPKPGNSDFRHRFQKVGDSLQLTVAFDLSNDLYDRVRNENSVGRHLNYPPRAPAPTPHCRGPESPGAPCHVQMQDTNRTGAHVPRARPDPNRHPDQPSRLTRAWSPRRRRLHTCETANEGRRRAGLRRRAVGDRGGAGAAAALRPDVCGALPVHLVLLLAPDESHIGGLRGWNRRRRRRRDRRWLGGAQEDGGVKGSAGARRPTPSLTKLAGAH
ncbi:hypothetical protein BHE74_00033889 [Ensete ventricosum]|nr:hypothetical protein GW17_00028132 [Ensete ventricosum]RWW59189.1 hypothetical protein BHE74_00033889 [Ensete ventricosum]RZS11089.1 hypothetical protein BHM03_00042379 [Ensete ventricosum]